jgi:phosphoglycerol transferase MdoB-like AlkP superfamily enzyme
VEPPAPDAASSIYRRFFIAGIAVVLTAGASWGAWLLLRLGLEGSFGAISPHDVNAHGHAQIFGWIGLFVMGFAYQAFPRFKHSALRRPWLALATFPIYVSGVILRTLGEAFHPSALALSAGLAGAALELIAILTFAWVIAETSVAPRRDGVSPYPYGSRRG